MWLHLWIYNWPFNVDAGLTWMGTALLCVRVSAHSRFSSLCTCVLMFVCARVRTSASLCMQNVCVCHQPCCPHGTLCSLTFLITLHKGDLMKTHRDREREHRWRTAAPSCQSASTTVMRLIDHKTEQRVPKDHITVWQEATHFILSFYPTPSFLCVNSFALSSISIKLTI